MASEAHAAQARRRLLSFTVLAVAMLVTGMASTVASVLYARMSAGAQDAQQRVQDATIARLDAAVTQLRRQQLAACSAAADLGSLPLPPSPPPSRLAVKIVTDNRAQWHGLGCPGVLPVPPGLAEAAARYHVPVNGKG